MNEFIESLADKGILLCWVYVIAEIVFGVFLCALTTWFLYHIVKD